VTHTAAQRILPDAPHGWLLHAIARVTFDEHAEPPSLSAPLLRDYPEVGADVVVIAREGAWLLRYEDAERFDVLPLLVATDGAIAES